jgi:hypothetical protein
MDEPFCPYDLQGEHKFHIRSWRVPYRPSPFRDVPVMTTRPAPLRYWEIIQCRRCGYERATAHGFTPALTCPEARKP